VGFPELLSAISSPKIRLQILIMVNALYAFLLRVLVVWIWLNGSSVVENPNSLQSHLCTLVLWSSKSLL
jgi:hypothetical protein